MLSARFADSSIDPLWSNKDRRMKKSIFALEIQELNFVGGGCRDLKERHLAAAILLAAAPPWLPGTWHPTFLDGQPISKPTSIKPAALLRRRR